MGDERRNKMSKVGLSKKDERFREFALEGNLWKVVFSVGFPLALYQTLSLIFRLLDTMMASHISAESVSAVAYLSQINSLLSAVGGGLAIGGSLQISKAYGAGDFEMVKKRVNSLLGLCGLLGLGVLCMVPFSGTILRVANTPKELIGIGSRYFSIELFAMVITYINNVYIAVERARGNTKRILKLNMIIIVVKLSLTALFVYVLNGDIQMIAIANVVAQSVMLVAAIVNLNKKGNAFGFSFKSISFKWSVIGPMLTLSGPVMVEKAAFSFGKVIVNSMSGQYGPLAVGALGISNNIGGVTTGPQNGFQESGAAIISQNLGANKVKRALDTFKKVLAINLMIGAMGLVVTLVFLKPISYLFASSASGFDTEFQNMIISMYRMECIGTCLPLGINAAVISLLLGFGYTKYTLLINFCRVFAFRIPVLYALQKYTDLGAISCGLVMLISNFLVTILSIVIAFFVIRYICKTHQIHFFGKEVLDTEQNFGEAVSSQE